MGYFSIPYGYNPARQTFPSYTGDRHLCTIGPNRSGKGATVIMQALLHVPHSVVVIDPKGQNAAVTARWRRAMGQEVYVLNPFGLHTEAPWCLPRHRYNPLAALDIKSANVVADAGAISQALIVTESRDPYFDDTARDLIKTIILYLAATLGPRASLADVRKMVTTIAARGPEAAILLERIRNSPQRFIAQPIGRFMDHEARDIASAINTAITQTAFLDDPAFSDPSSGALTASDFKLDQLKERPTTIYLILPGWLMETYGRFLRVFITSAIESVASKPGGHPVLMILDEFARLQALPAVTSAFGFAAGYNLQLWPFVQDLNQLQNLYGKEWMTIFANSGAVQFFTPVDMETADYLQRRGGTMTGETRSRNYTGRIYKKVQSETRSDMRAPLLPPERTMGLGPDESIIFFAGKHHPLLAKRQPYWKIPRLSGRFDPDPFHSA